MQDVKPLTAAEIAELRRLLKDGELTLSAEAAAALPRLLDEVERTRALLRRIEWSGWRRYTYDVPGKPERVETVESCPACGGRANEREHLPGCELAALLGGEG